MADVGNLKTRISLDSTQFAQSMAGVNRQLKGLQNEQRAVTSSGTGFARGLTEMKSKADVLTRTLTVQEAKVAELKRRYEENKKETGENSKATQNANVEYQKAKAEMSKTENALKNLTAEINRQSSNFTKLGDHMEKAGKKMQAFGKGMTSFGRGLTTRVTLPIVGLGAAALKVGMDFEEGMSKVEAVSGATGDDLQKLTDKAKELGESTRFSATEVSEGLYYMALAGWKTQEMLDGLPGVLDLAAASGEDLGRTSDIVTDGLSAFGMKAKESGRFADVLAAASANANTDVSGLGAAFQYVAPVAGALGFSIEDTATAIGLMSNAGVKGQKSGTALRAMMTNLAKPTESMQKQMKKLGISLTDSEGDMKSFGEIMQDMRGSFTKLTEEQQASAAATIFGKEAMSGALAIINATEDDYSKLSKAIAESEGAASEMAKVMQDNAKGAMIEFKSALEGAGIAASEHLIPFITDVTKNATDLVRKFGELDSEQQKQILKWIGLVAAIGPASIALGTTASVAGNVLTVGGKVSKMLGAASGTGMVGRLGLLGGPTGVAVVAAAGVGLLAYKLYDAHKESKELKEVSTETAEKLNEQASTLETLVDRFDELKKESGFTAEEFANLIDITKELEKTQNPARIAELQEQYEELAKKSGMSNDELTEMIDLNDDLVEKTPAIAESFTEKGNAIAGMTSEMREYIQSLRDAAIEEMRDEINQGLINEKQHLEDIKGYKQDLLDIDGDILELEKLREQPLENIIARIEEINQLLMDGTLELSEHDALQEELNFLRVAENELIDETLNQLYDKKGKIRDNIKESEEELIKLEEAKAYYAELLLAEIDINWEKGEGLAKLDDTIDKLKSERDEILKNLTEEEKRNGIHTDYIEGLDQAISKHESVRDRINEETGYRADSVYEQKRANEQAERQLRLQSEITKEHSHNNDKIDEGTRKAKKQNEELGKKITKKVDLSSNPSINDFQNRLSATVSKRINLISNNAAIPMPAYATGTNSHPGGNFIAGEKGWELGRMGDQWEMLNFGLYDRPSGYEVFTHNESKRILNAMNNIPKYADGARTVNAANDVINSMNNQPLVLEIHMTNNMDGREVGRTVEKYVTEIQGRNRKVVEGFA